jgi:hypothetical protein
MTTNNVTNNNPYGAVPQGQSFQVQNYTEGESTTNRVAKRKLEEFETTNTDLAQQNLEGIKHRKIEPRTLSEIFPYELWTYIFSFLDFKDFPSLRLASKELRDLAHETLKCGLEIMTYETLFYIEEVSKRWNLTIQLEPFNLNPINTKFYKVSDDPNSSAFSLPPIYNDWEQEQKIHCYFLKRADSLTALDLSEMFDQEEDKESVDANRTDLRRLMENVSSSLKRLDLSNNYFEIPAVLSILKTHDCALKTLFLNNTLLPSPTENKEFSTVALNDFPRTLQSLNLESLKKIDNQTPSFQLTGDFPTALTKLSLADNILSENNLPALPSSLTYLNLRAMRINDRETPFFMESDFSRIKEFSFGSLVTLNLSNNRLTELKEIMSKLSSSLEHLDLSYNYLEIPAVLATLKTHGCVLKTLNLHGTLSQNEKTPTVDLNDLPRTLKSLTLQSLNLDSLKIITQIPSFQLTGDFPTSLTNLSLSGNILPENSLPSLPSALEHLDFSAMRKQNIKGKVIAFFEDGNLSAIGNFPFKSLRTLNLNNNALTDKALGVIFMQNPNSPLEEIDLSSNLIALKWIDSATFRFPFCLKHLKLDNNLIRRLDLFNYLLIDYLLAAKTPISLKEISIKKNPLRDSGIREHLTNLPKVKKLFKWN